LVLFEKMKLLALLTSVYAGPFSCGICQTGCNSLAVACYASAGLTFGTVTAGAGFPAAAVESHMLFSFLLLIN
jgi:hypothetical protein